ncbi:MAG: dTDP-4-dehydrorhamnose reductase [Candidatus Omnitrophica bacterium]|nr:dTDP-4-dehydrorhamnose reductase [Candidatus Omnitrophota bacterium]
MEKILIFGANGQLGRAFVRLLDASGVSFVSADRAACDITRPTEVERLLDLHRPTVAVNCTAYNLVDDAEDNPELAFAVNAEAVKTVAAAAAQRQIKFVHYSTDFVFDGCKRQPYVESDMPNPLSVYAKSKLAGEEYTKAAGGDYLLFRVSWVVGDGKQNFLYKVSQWAAKTDTLRIADDEVSVPTSADTIARVSRQAWQEGLSGLYHLASSGQASRYELTRFYLDLIGLKDKTVLPVPMASFPAKARRPGYSVLSNAALSRALGVTLPDWKEGLQEFFGGSS